jgi:hypothetical protein
VARNIVTTAADAELVGSGPEPVRRITGHGFTRVEHVRAGIDGVERILAPEELATTPVYSTRYYAGDYWKKTEQIREGQIYLVEYYGVTWADPDLIARHLRQYPQIKCVLWNAPRGTDARKRIAYHISPEGKLAEIVEIDFDEYGDGLSEERRRPDGALLERIEYIYDDEREIVGQRFVHPNGKVFEEMYDEP